MENDTSKKEDIVNEEQPTNAESDSLPKEDLLLEVKNEIKDLKKELNTIKNENKKLNLEVSMTKLGVASKYHGLVASEIEKGADIKTIKKSYPEFFQSEKSTSDPMKILLDKNKKFQEDNKNIQDQRLIDIIQNHKPQP